MSHKANSMFTLGKQQTKDIFSNSTYQEDVTELEARRRREKFSSKRL